MVVRCDKCQARYRIDDGRIGPGGLTLKCGKCQHLFPATPAAPARAKAPAAPPRPATAPGGGPPLAGGAERPNAPRAGGPQVSFAGQGVAGRRRVRPGGRILALAAAIAALLVALAAFVAAKKGDAGRPPAAAIRSLDRARALAEQDAIALFPQAIEATRSAIAAAPQAPFGEAHALAAEIEVAWADALADLADRARAKAHLDAALMAAKTGERKDPRSSDVSVALADYYRASGAPDEMGRELARAGELHADPARLALVEGLALAQSALGAAPAEAGDAGRRAAERLRQAAGAHPGSARVHYRLAQALAAQHKEEEALAELRETVRLSPVHERAKALLEAMATPGGGGTR